MGVGETKTGRVYRGREVDASVLREGVLAHFETVRREFEESGGMPGHVFREVTKFVECGVLANGFTRVYCDSCRTDVLVPFSCKGRAICPSCSARRAHEVALLQTGPNLRLPKHLCGFELLGFGLRRARRKGGVPPGGCAPLS